MCESSDDQALKSDTIPFLVRLLETGLEAQENPAAVKAQIVKAIKAMQMNPTYCEQVWMEKIFKNPDKYRFFFIFEDEFLVDKILQNVLIKLVTELAGLGINVIFCRSFLAWIKEIAHNNYGVLSNKIFSGINCKH